MLLYVCTGNQCRSPFAERRTETLVASRPDGPVACSAGTRPDVGARIDSTTRRVLAEYGSRADGHSARRLSESLVSEAGLVLTMTAEHRSAVLRLAPGALRKTFLLLEARELLALLDPADDPVGLPAAQHVSAMATRLARARARRPLPHPDVPEIPDPIGEPLRVHRKVAALIEDALQDLLPRLAPRVVAH